MAHFTRRGFVASLFVAPAIVRAASIMPVKVIDFLTVDTISYTLQGFDAYGAPLTETISLPLDVEGIFDPMLIEAKKPLFSRINSITWSEPPSLKKETASQEVLDCQRQYPWRNAMNHGRTNVTEEIHRRSPLVNSETGEINQWEELKYA